MADGTSRRGFLQGTALGAAGAAIGGAPAVGRAAQGEAGAATADHVPIRVTVDGDTHEVTVHPDESLLELVRDRLGNKAPKLGCGHGSCGACSVLVDGQETAACLTPAVHVQDQSVRTLTGLNPDDGGLHPVQRAFLHHDALQCGYCTPGFVTASIAFYGDWRKVRGTDRPSKAEVADALAGHLCRCGTYQSIFAAVADACAGRFDDQAGDMARYDGPAKVRGEAVYTVDLALDGMLQGHVLRSPHAHAVLQEADLEPARKMPGVKAVVMLMEVGSRVRFHRQEVAAVAADTARQAEAAAAAIRLKWQVVPAVTNLKMAMAEGSPLVYGDTRKERKAAPNAGETPSIPAPWDGNVRGPTNGHFFSKPRKADELMEAAKKAGRAVSETWKTQVQLHTALEPHAAVALWDLPDKLTVHLSTQAVSWIADEIAERWDLKRDHVTVRTGAVGGGFGAKATLQMEVVAAVELARQANRPVRVALDRADELVVGGLRPAQEIRFDLSATDAGSIEAMKMQSLGDAGVSVGNNCALIARVLYPTKAKRLEDYDVLTNGPPGKPFRAPGGPPSVFAVEGAVDAIAHQRGEDPLRLRRRWDPNPARNRLYDTIETLDLWTGRGGVAADKGRYRRGVGLAVGAWPAFVSPVVRVQLTATRDGFVAACSCQDIGTGSKSVVAGEVAAVLGIDPRAVDVRFGDSNLPHGPLSGGSRTTASIGPAARDAAEQLVEELLDVARSQLGIAYPEAGSGVVKGPKGKTLTFSEVVARTAPVTVTGKRRRDPAGYFLPMTVAELRILEELPGSVQITEVEVDTRLGRVKANRVWIGIAVGRIYQPRLARSQVEGAVLQATSFALYEERRRCPIGGHILTRGLEDYRIAGLGEMPEVTVHFDQDGFQGVRGGGVGLGEISTVPGAASVANAVFHATGWRPTDLPIRPGRVMEGLA